MRRASAVLLLWLMATSAVWQTLTFTAPEDHAAPGDSARAVSRYELQRSYDDTTWTPASLWRAIGDTSRPVPAPPGDPEALLVSISESEWVWRAGGTRLRLRAVDAAGNVAEWSHMTVSAGPDTEWVVEGWRAVPRRRTIGPRPFAALSQGDSVPVRLLHQEDVQRANLRRLCEIFGQAQRRGAPDSAWCIEGQ